MTTTATTEELRSAFEAYTAAQAISPLVYFQIGQWAYNYSFAQLSDDLGDGAISVNNSDNSILFERDRFMEGYTHIVFPFSYPLVLWTLLAYYVSDGFWSGGMDFMIKWSLYGVVCMNIIGSHLEDIRFVSGSLLYYDALELAGADRISWNDPDNYKNWRTRVRAIYSAYPEFRVAFWLKVLLNILNIYIAVINYDSAETYVRLMAGWIVSTEDEEASVEVLSSNG